MKNIKKYLMSFIIIVTIITIFIPTKKVYAENKIYDIKKLEVNVNISNDGSVVVTENWYLNFTSGQFTRFQKDIYNPATNLEKFDIDENSFKVYINDKECNRVNNTEERKEYTYYLSINGKNTNIQWYYPANEENVKYTVTYTLEDAVVETDNDVALFCYRYVGINFDKTIEETNITITAPGDSNIEVRHCNKTYSSIGENPKKIIIDKSSNLTKINVAMDAKCFYDLRYCDLETLKTEENQSNGISRPNSSLITILLIFAAFFILIIVSTRDWKLIHKKILIAKNKTKFEALLSEKNYLKSLVDECEEIHDPMHYIFIDETIRPIKVLILLSP